MRTRAALVTAFLVATAMGAFAPATAGATTGGSCRPTIAALPLLPGTTSGQVLEGHGDGVLFGGVNTGPPPTSPVQWTRTSHGWTVTDLGGGGAYRGFAEGMDKHGDILISGMFGAWLRTPNGVHHPLRDFTGRPTTNVFAREINRDGVIAGGTVDAAGRFYGAIWRSYAAIPTKLDPLPVPGTSDSVALGINDRGDAVGNSNIGPSDNPTDNAGGVWYRGRQRGRLLVGLHGDHESFPVRINDSREMAGSASNRTFTYAAAAVWSAPDRPRFLGTLLPADVFASFYGLSAGGRAAGESDTASGQYRVVYWPGRGPLRTLQPLSRNWATGNSAGHYVTDDGVVAGGSTDAAGVLQPTVWTCADRQSFVPPRGARMGAGRPDSRPGVRAGAGLTAGSTATDPAARRSALR